MNRFFFFVFISLGIHLVCFQVDLPQRVSLQNVQQVGVDFADRAFEDFYLAVQSTPAPKKVVVKSHLSALQQANVKKPTMQKIVPTKAAVVPKTPSSELKTISPKVTETEKVNANPNSKKIYDHQPDELSRSAAALDDDLLWFARDGFENEIDTASFVGLKSQNNSEHAGSRYQRALPRYDLNPSPHYPETALRRKLHGTVRFEVFVLENGKIGEVELLSSSGYKVLDRAGLKAVRRWQFKPATSMGLPVESRIVVPLVFKLESN